MTPEQFDRLVRAIEANTLAQIEVASAVADLADQTAAAVDALTGEDQEEEGQQAMDMAGRPILAS